MRCDECVYNSPAWVDRRPLCAEVQRGTGTTPGCDFGFKPEGVEEIAKCGNCEHREPPWQGRRVLDEVPQGVSIVYAAEPTEGAGSPATATRIGTRPLGDSRDFPWIGGKG